MNKKELIITISAETAIPQKTVQKVIDSLLRQITETVHKGERVKLVGFGTFYLAKRAARTGRNPRTNEIIKIPARKKLAFKPSSNTVVSS